MAKQENPARNLENREASDTPFADRSQHDYASFWRRSRAERRLMDERIAEADKGIFISAEAMHRWVESWGTENELPPPEPDIFPEPHRS
jgi:hypothetical protein